MFFICSYIFCLKGPLKYLNCLWQAVMICTILAQLRIKVSAIYLCLPRVRAAQTKTWFGGGGREAINVARNLSSCYVLCGALGLLSYYSLLSIAFRTSFQGGTSVLLPLLSTEQEKCDIPVPFFSLSGIFSLGGLFLLCGVSSVPCVYRFFLVSAWI